jgi:hypothetical protein
MSSAFKLLFLSCFPIFIEKLADARDTMKEANSFALVTLYLELHHLFDSTGKDKFSSAGEMMSAFEQEILACFHSKIPRTRENVLKFLFIDRFFIGFKMYSKHVQIFLSIFTWRHL